MPRRLKIAIAIGVLVFALGLCGGTPNSQSSPKSGLHSMTTFMIGKYPYYLYHHAFLSH